MAPHGRPAMALRLALRALSLILSVTPFFVAAQEKKDADCASCHEQPQAIEKSVHRAVGCARCHPRHESYPHPEGIAKPVCSSCHERISSDYSQSVHARAAHSGKTAPECATCHDEVHEIVSAKSVAFRKAIPDGCGRCHAAVTAQFKDSVHGTAIAKEILAAPVCTDCHGEHSIVQASAQNSPVNVNNVRETCAQCHANVRLARRFGVPSDRVVSFDASFHGLAAKSGQQTVASCASCHGVHNILPSSNARSTIHPKNLRATCGKCHERAGERFALGPVHLLTGVSEPGTVRLARRFYLVVIPVTIGLMFIHNLGDWIRKLRRRRLLGHPAPWTDPHRAPVRVYPFERLVHFLLAVSFIVLAWTGFLLKYPDQWWARPALIFEGSISVRGIIHRTAAVVFLITAGMHVISLIANRRLREHWTKLWPRYDDLREAWHSFAYNLGLRPDKPHLSAYDFAAKAEYWALVWGGVVMAVSGVLLWANNLALRWLPKEWLDFATAVHFYEAILACLAILVWHLYIVIFDPDVYPGDPSWITGKSVRPHEAETVDEMLATTGD
jgi:formate dehydrogenase gamma subunit